MPKTLPKIDLHLHIDGSARPETVLELAKKQGIELGNLSLEEITKLMVMQPDKVEEDFREFDTPIAVMQTEEALERITYELIETLAKQGILYAELRFAPQQHCEKGLDQCAVIDATIRGMERGKRDFPEVGIGLILCCMAFGPAAQNRAENFETVRLSKEYLGRGIVAMDLAGWDDRLPEFAELFELAAELGVPYTCHAEFYVPNCIPFAQTRIGHGYQVAQQEMLIAAVKEKGIMLEMCPTSSFIYDLPKDGAHPLKHLFDRGVAVTVNTDNMTVLATDMETEHECCRAMGFTDEEIVQMTITSAQYTFLPETEKAALVQKVKSYLK